jgi:hypothetical protein
MQSRNARPKPITLAILAVKGLFLRRRVLILIRLELGIDDGKQATLSVNQYYKRTPRIYV